jgi:hypothetical protein
MRTRKPHGTILLLVLVVVAVAMACATALAIASAGAGREEASARALAQAREALLAYAADRPIDARVGPGYLPCPDLDDDGWAEATCGSLTGHLGQAERLGRLPWKTLGLPDLRDGHGERLWYAVSSRHKGLLNCAASRACVDMTPPIALGTITVRGAAGEILHDGTRAETGAEGGAAAIVFAPGPPMRRLDGHLQGRDCAAGDCRDPRNYLDASAFEDNAAFTDRTDAPARAGNADGFVKGPAQAGGSQAVNDRLAILTYDDVMSRVKHRIALELALCLRGMPELPAPESPCGATSALGRVPDEALGSPACNARADESTWWARWKDHVLYARAIPAGLTVVDEQGRVAATERRFAVLVTQHANECATGFECDAAGCASAKAPPRGAGRHDALVASR